jgi:excisionase family DNA binding protein
MDITIPTSVARELIAKIDKLQNSVNVILQQHAPVPALGDYLSLEQAAEFICRSKSTVYGMVTRGEIPNIKKGKRLLFKRTDLEEWINKGARKTFAQQVEDAERAMIEINAKRFAHK